MAEQGKRSKEHWWNTFQKASFPAYATLVDPPSLRDVDTDPSQVRVQALLMDDVLDTGGYRRGSAPQQLKVAEGSFVLVLPSNASSAHAQFVSPPWLCRVNRIWFLPGGDASGASGHQEVKGTAPEVQQWERRQLAAGRVAAQHFQLQEVKGTAPEVQQWERRQIAAGRVAAQHLQLQEVKGTAPEVQQWERRQFAAGRAAAQHFQLQVAYFYRWPDLVDAIDGSSNNTRRRIVTYFYRWPDLVDAIEGSSNNTRRLAKALTNLGITQQEKDVEALLRKRGCGRTPPTHFGMRYVVFSNHETKDPRSDASSRDEAAEDGAEDGPVPMESVMGTAEVLFLPSGSKLPYQQAPPPAAAIAAAASSTAKASQLPQALQTRLFSQRRQLVPGFVCNMFLAKAEGPEQQPKLFGLSEWADGSAGAALKDRAWVPGSRQQHESGQSGDQGAVAAGGGRKRRRPQLQQQQLAARGPAAGSSRGAGAAGKDQQQQQQQQRKRRRVLGLDSDDQEDEQQQLQLQQQEVNPGSRILAELLAAEREDQEDDDDDEEDDEGEDEDDSEDESEDGSEDEEDGEPGDAEGLEAAAAASSGLGEDEEGPEEVGCTCYSAAALA
ncbi:hypothetical protein OEZ85_004712 [Tetradesmus obliquus]|uniref:Uncharacterized protein n=1 Tax=Tetradesmus obliquus TaxID=3088 RepID=A0ABY8ULR5_TETOB|nr:hypothetical protein OEZ85_004712 [Tetradesmus obliquus]